MAVICTINAKLFSFYFLIKFVNEKAFESWDSNFGTEERKNTFMQNVSV